jgi:hypothetical protein
MHCTCVGQKYYNQAKKKEDINMNRCCCITAEILLDYETLLSAEKKVNLFATVFNIGSYKKNDL